jgi:hypothetical protein
MIEMTADGMSRTSCATAKDVKDAPAFNHNCRRSKIVRCLLFPMFGLSFFNTTVLKMRNEILPTNTRN